MDDVDIKVGFQLSSAENYGARYELAERLREVLTEAIEDRQIEATGVEILDFDVVVDD